MHHRFCQFHKDTAADIVMGCASLISLVKGSVLQGGNDKDLIPA